MSEHQVPYTTNPGADQPQSSRPDLAAIRTREQAATPGPWRWRANLSIHHVWLASLAKARQIVMNFHRWGMWNAQPHFNVDGLMCPAAYIVPAPHNAWDATGIDHPDARFIEHAREDIPSLLAYCERLEAAGDRLAEGLAEEGWGETDSVVAWRQLRGQGGHDR